MTKIYPHIIILLITLNLCFSKNFVISFYNVENLFDIYDSDDTNDFEFTPEGRKKYTQLVYNNRLKNISFVISQIGNDFSNNGPDIIGLAEIENRTVLEDLIKHPNIIKKNYSVVHYDSPDNRGIDVALLYKPTKFDFEESKKFKIEFLNNNGKFVNTRDILLVSGKLEKEKTHVIVNHWPSRYGGKLRTESFRKKAALVTKSIIDSILSQNPNDHIIIMGDFNDDPTDESLIKILNPVRPDNPSYDKLLNLYIDIHKKGMGTSLYKGNWNLFDQIIISRSLIKSRRSKKIKVKKVGIYNEPYLFQKIGKYKGYPFRAYSGDTYIGGYSDHFPVYIILETK